MKRTIAITVLFATGCATAPTADSPPAVPAPLDAFGVAEAHAGPGGAVERMHRDEEGVVALVVTSQQKFTLLRLRFDGEWRIIEEKVGSQDYLWPAQ